MNGAIRVAVAVVAGVLTLAATLVMVVDFDQSGWAFAFLGYLVVGAVIVWHRPATVLGWLMVAVGASTAAFMIELWYVRGPLGPGPVAVEVAFLPLGTIPWLAMMLLVLLFPDGRATTRLQLVMLRVIGVVGAVALLANLTNPVPLTSGRDNPLVTDVIAPLSAWVMGPGFLMILVLLLVALVGLVQRWRSSEGDRRVQFQWLLWGVVITIVVIPVMFVFSGDASSSIAIVMLLAMWSIPVAIGIAVTRYRLYDINQVVSRTASYAIVTGLLLLTYVALVTAVTRAVGSQPPWVIASATLAVAALFRPLLTRVQRVVDRRFNREKYDAQREVDRFSTLLTEVVDAERARSELLDVTRRTLGPQTVLLWTADGTRH
jgi:hypothetical protein